MSNPDAASKAEVLDKGALPRGISEEQLRKAISKSGYPLQFFAGEVLRGISTEQGESFRVHDEWTFIDPSTNESRNLDIKASLNLPRSGTGLQVRPMLTLLIECKQSELPYIFFGRQEDQRLWKYPIIAGLKSEDIELTTDDTGSTWTYPISGVLELSSSDFARAPLSCRSFSKCVRKGKEIELSGTEAYNSIVQPLTKALRHLLKSEMPPKTFHYFDAHLTVAIAVLDAPMYAVTVEGDVQKLEAISRLRVLRHEHESSEPRYSRDRIYAIEVVSKDRLSEFIVGELLPFAEMFASRATEHATELANGRGFVSGLSANSSSDILNRLRSSH